MTRVLNFSRLFFPSGPYFRCISTSGGGKESVPSTKVKDPASEDDANEADSRRSQLPDPEGVKRASKSWMGQLPHEEDPTVGWDIIRTVVGKDGKDTIQGISIEGNAWAANMFPQDTVIRMHTKKDISPQGFRRWRQRLAFRQELQSQLFTPERHGILGPDLASAHFICFRKGKVKFLGYDNWWFDHNTLPKQYDPLYLIEKIDATDCKLFYEGVDNICNLHQMTELDLTNNSKLNVWSFDKLYRQYRYTSKLERLVLRNCINFCERSLAAAYRIPSLKEIVITNTAASKYQFLDLTIHLLNDVNPDIKVVV